ncbi:MAG: bifunctional glutamate N-acetyltransferase/amino-acid acetyltransferase ArgJ [Sarcina sp.]
MKILKGGVTEPKGFLASGIHCGIKKRKEKLDLALIYSEKVCNAAGVYTQNIVKGNPIYVCQEHLKDKKAQAIIINSGNANTCSGEDGLAKAYKMTEYVEREAHIKKQDVLVASTGVIGAPLNIEKIDNNISKLIKSLDKKGNIYAREAIMTTDLIKKEVAISININGNIVKIGGMAKGSGMINPNMATTLAFITTDCEIDSNMLEKALKCATDKSFNRISVDGDQSTNDTILILANGLANNEIIVQEDTDYKVFLEGLEYVLIELAKLVAKDGEGATKLIECTIKGAKTEEDGVKFAKSIIQSNLVKTAMFGNDANWGRILCALGYSNINFDINNIDIAIESSKGFLEVFKEGIPILFDEDKAKLILDNAEINIMVNLKEGVSTANAFGCDLTYEYISINGDYRT